MTLVERYLGLLDDLLKQRASGPLSDAKEQQFAVAMNDVRRQMGKDEVEALDEALVERWRIFRKKRRP
jgi:hypothetical protein